MDSNLNHTDSLAASITRSASKQSYYTIRWLADRDRIPNAYRAYGYLRWVDDVIDVEEGTKSEKIAFVNRQKSLIETCYRGDVPEDLCAEERIVLDLISTDPDKNSGLHKYLCNMMAVMCFDVGRRGQVVSEAELSEYTLNLATAVTEAIYYFIGHSEPGACDETRYMAVTAAHITHMLRDTAEDMRAGYFNIPREYLSTHEISPADVPSPAYREWVCARVQLARTYFKAGRESVSQSKNWRRRLAVCAYMARFEWILHVIERENYCLRSEYPERKGLRAGLWMGWRALASAAAPIRLHPIPVAQ